MDFNFDFSTIERLFPEYLTKSQKGRLLDALAQFKDAIDSGKWSSKIYSSFYTSHQYDYFLQADLVREIR